VHAWDVILLIFECLHESLGHIHAEGSLDPDNNHDLLGCEVLTTSLKGANDLVSLIYLLGATSSHFILFTKSKRLKT